MKDFKRLEVWFVTGSQFLYGEETLKTVDSHSQEIVNQISRSSHIPITLIFKPVLKTPDEIYDCIRDANSSKNCDAISSAFFGLHCRYGASINISLDLSPEC